MKLFEVLKRRKSTRSYTGKPVNDEQLKAILQAAYSSPVAMGRFDDMHLTVITEQALLNAIGENMRQKTGREGDPLYGAPMLILVSVKPSATEVQNSEYSSAAMIAHNMTLAATALGLGSCDIWGAIRLAQDEPELIARFDLPAGFVAVCSVVLGETDEIMPERDVPEGKISVHFLI